tara:strand:+ start:1143 stop:1724 length:582 start_codon:yes stop_codon:yes gene_type:complete
MIAYLRGKLIEKNPLYSIIDVNGVGYQTYVSLSTFYGLPELGTDVTLKIHTHVREDELKLFGFANDQEQKVFEKLISITKVGPKLALTILSGMSVGDFLGAVSNRDIIRLNAIPGVGSKTAERLVLEMKDKLKDLISSSSTTEEQSHEFDDALSALMNLGYKRPQAEKALKKVAAQGTLSLQELIKNTLKVLV